MLLRRASLLIILLAALPAGCAQTPLDTEGVDDDLSPGMAQSDIEQARDRSVIWGGTIIRSRNLEDRTRIEVVSYPLEPRSLRPRTGDRPGTRFLVYLDGYLETAEYEPGRLLTVRGRVAGIEEGSVGEAPYEYPWLEATDLHLWPARGSQTESRSRVNFGIGIIFSR